LWRVRPENNTEVRGKRTVEMKRENKIKKVMEEYRHGKLKSSSGKKVIKPEQAIAIALAEAGRRKR
jgi:hypothetical protein